MFDSYFTKYAVSFPDVLARQEFCASIMEGGLLFYEEAHGNCRKVGVNLIHTHLTSLNAVIRDYTSRLSFWRLFATTYQ